MYAFFKGTLAAAAENYAVVECGGIGYKIFAPRRFLDTAAVGGQVKLYTHLIVREDELSLYGFESEAGKQMFERLIGISGIGPKAGLAILSQIDVYKRQELPENATVPYQAVTQKNIESDEVKAYMATMGM